MESHENDVEQVADKELIQSNQEIFEQTFGDLMNGFGEQCAKHNVECSIAIAKHPDFDDPMIFYRGQHIIEAASLMAKVLRQMKAEIYSELNTDTNT